MRIDWVEPAVNNAAITKYEILLQDENGDFFEDRSLCDGGDSGIMAQFHCLIPMTVFRASPFNKVQGEFVKAKVIAFNGRGQSLASAETSGGVPMETEPHQITTLANGSGTSHLQVEIEWDAPDDGGSTISSYVISWDQGTGDDS